jgi:hypothetical protein
MPASRKLSEQMPLSGGVREGKGQEFFGRPRLGIADVLGGPTPNLFLVILQFQFGFCCDYGGDYEEQNHSQKFLEKALARSDRRSVSVDDDGPNEPRLGQ